MKFNEFISKVDKMKMVETNLRSLIGGVGPTHCTDTCGDFENECNETIICDGTKEDDTIT